MSRINVLVVFFSLILTACSAGLSKNIQFNQDSENAIIAIEVIGLQQSQLRNFGLDILPYDPSTNEIDSDRGGMFTGSFKDAPLKVSRHFLFNEVKPGAYVVASVVQQDHWTACYHAETVYFDAEPGKITFVGRYDPAPTLQDLQQEALRTSQDRTSIYGYVTLFDNIRPPSIVEADRLTGSQEALEAELAKAYPGVQAPVVDAKLRPAHFETAWDIFKTTQSCWRAI